MPVKCLSNQKGLRYVNSKSERVPIKVGPRGGLSIKPKTAKNRRYLTKTCESKGNTGFWKRVSSIRKKRNVTRKMIKKEKSKVNPKIKIKKEL